MMYSSAYILLEYLLYTLKDYSSAQYNNLNIGYIPQCTHKLKQSRNGKRDLYDVIMVQ